MTTHATRKCKRIEAVTVYCASSRAIDEVYFSAARTLGAGLARSGRRLIYGGGNLGLMGTVAEAVHARGGPVHGIITEKLKDLEQARVTCDQLEIVPTMRLRKQRMEELADAFIALPGGLGTFEELFEMIVARLLREHQCPIILVNIKGYFDPFTALFEHAIQEGFMKPGVQQLFEIVETAEAAVGRLDDYEQGVGQGLTESDLGGLIPSSAAPPASLPPGR